MSIVLYCEPRAPHTYHFEIWRDDRPASVGGGVIPGSSDALDVISNVARMAAAIDAWYAPTQHTEDPS